MTEAERKVQELVEETSLKDIAEAYRPVAEIIGVQNFLLLCDYAKGDELYFPKLESALAPARNRRIRKEWDGYNTRKLAERYNLTDKQIQNILKDEQLPGQMSIYDFLG